MMKKIKKFCLACLCGVLLVTQVILPQPVQAISTNDDEFQMFLARYLDNNYMIDRLDQLMFHQYLYGFLKEQYGIINFSVALTNLANDWGYAINGKTDIYEDILLDLLHDYIKSDLFKLNVEGSKNNLYDEFIEFIEEGIDYTSLFKDNIEIAKDYADKSKSTIDLLLNMPTEKVLDYTFNDLASKFSLPSRKDLFFSGLEYVPSIIEIGEEVCTYLSIKEQTKGILDVYEQMYRNTKNSELRVALKRILDKFNAISDKEIMNFISKEMSTRGNDLSITVIENIYMNLLNIVGAGIKTGGFLSELTYKSETLSSTQLMLEAELDIENEIKNVIVYGQNTFKNSVTHARRLNMSFIFLYEAYEYGIDLVKKYNDAVFQATNNVIEMEYPEENLADYHNYNEKEKAFVKNIQFHDEFASTIKTWDSIINNDRTLFDSAWQEYKSTYYKELEKKIEEYKSKKLIESIAFDKENIVLNKDEITNITTFLDKPKVNPSNTDNPILIYTSSDPSILAIPNERIYGIQIRKTGKVTVTAKTLDGYHVATQTIIIVDSNTPEDEIPDDSTDENVKEESTNNETTPLVPQYEYAYELNSTGITVTEVINDFTDYGVYEIPSIIDGKIVTEVDFSNSDLKYERKVYNWKEQKHEKVKDYLDEIILPNTVTKIADHCFDLTDKLILFEVQMGNQVETIGEYAFKGVELNNFIIPSSVTSIGKHAFECCSAKSITIDSSYLTIIPESCFKYIRTSKINFTDNVTSLKEIGNYAFSTSHISDINLPDSIEIIGEYAFEYCYSIKIDSLPKNIIEIKDYAFACSTAIIEYFPENIKKIGKNAFSSSNNPFVFINGPFLYHFSKEYTPSYGSGKHLKNLHIKLPESIEFIGENAFNNSLILDVEFYGENSSSNLFVGKGSFQIDQYFRNGIIYRPSCVEIPNAATKLDQIFLDSVDIKEISTNFYHKLDITWTNGLDEIICDVRPIKKDYDLIVESRMNLYLKDISRIGHYTLNGHIFFNYEYYNYIEIPTNYLKNSSVLLSDGWMKEVMIIGEATQQDLERYVMVLKGAVDENGCIKYKDPQGNVTLLYENPKQRYQKVSQAIYENNSDYVLSSNLKHENNILNTNKEKTMSLKASCNDDTLSIVGVNAWFNLKEWVDEGETTLERAKALPNAEMFEDLYLKQPIMKYFEISLEDSKNNNFENGKENYVFSIKTQELMYRYGTVALYHLSNNGKITRIPVYVNKDAVDCEVFFKTNTLGQFVLVSLGKTKEVIEYPYLDELHQYYEENKQIINNKEPITYDNGNGSMIFVSEDSREESTIETIKPTINEDTKEEIISNFEIDDSLINNDNTDDMITEESLDGLNLWNNIEESLIKIETTQDNESVQVAITQLLEKYNALNLFKVEEVDGKLTLVDITKDAIRELKEKQANPLITSNNRDYYQLKLDNKGTYYFGLHESDSKVNYRAANSIPPFVIGGLGFIAIVSIVVLLILKKRTNN